MPKKPQRSSRTRNHELSAEKARKILHDGTVHGHPLTPRQRRFMGAVASRSKRRRG